MRDRIKYLIAFVLPFVIHSAFVSLNKLVIHADSGWYDKTSIAISIVAGLLILLRAKMASKTFKYIIGLAYVGIMYFCLYWFTFLFVGVVFGDFL